MNLSTFQQGANHLGGIQVRPTRASKEQARSGSPLLTRSLTDKKKEICRLDEISMNVLTNTSTEPTHKI